MASPAAIERIFSIGSGSPLARAGCQLRYANGDLSCTGTRAPVGAFLPDGERFDLALPFHYPFARVLDQANGKAGP